MARILVTGSADGVGRLATQTLLDQGHEVVVHVRNCDRLSPVRDLIDGGAAVVVGGRSDRQQTRGLADEVNRLGRTDAVINNAGVYAGPQVKSTCSTSNMHGALYGAFSRTGGRSTHARPSRLVYRQL
jgi:NAD(P)-dependent dehydrogenase (short-subunit alcohol dehydrogenase family)